MATDVGIRELRQNLSVYLRRVARGERFVVTERGRAVAELTPRPDDEDSWERLMAEHRMSRPEGTLDELPAPIEYDDSYAGTRALMEDRGDPVPP